MTVILSNKPPLKQPLKPYSTFMTDNPLYSVTLTKGEWVDETRENRAVPYKIYAPRDFNDGLSPVVLWSHGYGGSRDGASFLSRYLAAHGFTLVHMTHIGTDTSIWEGKDGHPWDILRKTKIDRSVTLNRFRDIPFVIDQLKTLDLPIDMNRIGMSGHSFGALSTQVACSQLFPDENGEYQSFAEPRIKAGIAYSPVPIDHLSAETIKNQKPDSDVYSPITKPILYMTGTADSDPIENLPYTHRFKVFENTGSDKKFMLVKSGGDHMVYNGTRGKLGDQANRERLEEIIQTVSLQFWDWQLRGHENAKDWFTNGEATAYFNGDGEFI